MKTILTTVGTSLFTNYMKPEVRESPEFDYGNNYESIGGPGGFVEQLEGHGSKIPERLNASANDLIRIVKSKWLNNTREDASAEIQSLLLIQKSLGVPIEIVLIASDTALSKIAAELIEYYFTEIDESENFRVTATETVQGLKVTDAGAFKKDGLLNLFRTISEYLVDESVSSISAINITGGYKATIPYLTILGQINQVDIFYLYEGTDSLLKIAPLPLKLDYGFIGAHIQIFTDLENVSKEDWVDYKRRNNLPELIEGFVEVVEDGETAILGLNPIGKYLLDNYRSYIIVEVEKGVFMANDQPGNRRMVYDAIKELYKRLKDHVQNNSNVNSNLDLIASIRNLGTQNDLRHGQNPGNDIFIFASTKQAQIRIVYTPELIHGEIKIKMFDYRRGNFDHAAYIQEFAQLFNGLTSSDFNFVQILLKKN